MIALAAAPAAAEEPTADEVAAREDAVKLEPRSPWNIDFGEKRCRLSRLFGSDDSPHLLYIEQASPSKGFELTLAGPELKRYERRRFERNLGVDVGFIGYVPMIELRPMRGEVSGYGDALIFSTLAIEVREELADIAEERRQITGGLDLQRANSINRFVIKNDDDILSFETGNMQGPFQALNACTEELLIRWGLNPEQHKLYTPTKWTNIRTLAQRISETFPRDALRKGEQGVFRMRLIVEEDGSWSECTVENATATETLQSPACQAMKRAKFEPALDAQGNPMRSYYATRIIYAIDR
ncbi:TonB family protein [Erythrobacter sp. HA6-11]